MHFTFVGDDDQSIYGWRGSNNSIIKSLVENNNIDTYYLLTNYRNNPNIVKAGNVILNHITGRAKKDQPIKPNKETGTKIRIACYDDKYTNLTNEVERLIESGYSAEDISILSRDNDDKARISHSLNAAEIPVARERIKIDVNDNYKLMKAIICILNEYDIIAACREIKRICNGADLTENHVKKVVLGKTTPSEALRKIPLLADELGDQNNDTLAKAVIRYSLKAGELFENSVNDRHSDPVFESFELFCSNNSAPWPISAKQLKEIFHIFEDNTRKENQSGGALDSGVKISTIHSAKGLEYEVVLITGLSLGKYPNTELIDNNFNLRNAQLQTLQDSKQSFERLKQSVKDNFDNDIIDSNTNKLVTNGNFKQYIAERLVAFKANNPIFNNLPFEANGFFEKAMGLLYIGEFTGSDFKTEFAHNIQRMAESLLVFASGPNAKLFKTNDNLLATQISDDIHKATKNCVTSSVSKRYAMDLLTKESKFGDDLLSLKSAGVFHYTIRSGRYPIEPDVLSSWHIKDLANNPDKFLAAIIDIANTRNILIHPSDKRWPDDPVAMLLSNIEILIKNCCFNNTPSISTTSAINTIKTSDIEAYNSVE